MKRICLLLLLTSQLACSGGGSDPVEPEDSTPPPPVIVSGTFDVTSTLFVNECEQTTVWGGTYDVVIDSLSFSMGPWTGSWDPKKLFAKAESEKDITLTRDCKATRWSTVYVTFLSKDKFKATLLYKLSLGGDCGTRTGCTSSWNLVGVRQVAETYSAR